ncbi:hypothetical protein [Limosilactobacillus fermentum]|uniref:hypothetical protein n=1 Tax=Limosilactobacillus fermentum TaxID=1613 RepID=UPI0013B3C17B|nr:hypothetical protein [Limosilactobacillus fermentum]UUC14517.1 hypothetical protein NOV98_05745 [Limosilactobacillus fermentum]
MVAINEMTIPTKVPVDSFVSIPSHPLFPLMQAISLPLLYTFYGNLMINLETIDK